MYEKEFDSWWDEIKEGIPKLNEDRIKKLCKDATYIGYQKGFRRGCAYVEQLFRQDTEQVIENRKRDNKHAT